MSKIKITLPDGVEPRTGLQVTFNAPCDCVSATCLLIGSDDYVVVDAIGRTITGISGAWTSGSLVSVVLDCDNKKAYVQNAAVTPVRQGSITMTATDWSGDGPFIQSVDVVDVSISPASKIDIQPDADVIAMLIESGTTALYVSNDGMGGIVAHALGAAPTVDFVIQATVTEIGTDSVSMLYNEVENGAGGTTLFIG